VRTLKDAQGDLKAFDAIHWPHNVGVESIRHTYLHLSHALFRFMGNMKEPMNDQSWKEVVDYWNREVTGRFMEHGIRLANNCFVDLEEKISIIFEKPTKLECHPALGESSWFDGVSYQMRMDGLNREKHFRNLMLNSLGSLDHLSHICERLDHGEPLTYEKKIHIEETAGGLVVWTMLFHLLDHIECSEEESIDHIVRIFDRRLAELSVQFEYSP